MANKIPSVNQIVLPAPNASAQRINPSLFGIGLPRFLPQQWAPAWFYSALNWLGKTYYDANNVPQQSFNIYMAGSDVDPYAQIGSTRLFLIILRRRPDSASRSHPTATRRHPEPTAPAIPTPTKASARCTWRWPPARSSPASSSATCPAASESISIRPLPRFRVTCVEQHPAERLRSRHRPPRCWSLDRPCRRWCPLDDFIKTHNEQIYNPSPVIVPLVAALVYDLTKYNSLGATTFTLPTFYTRDRVAAGTDYVSKLGQTVLFARRAGL